jgi:hypothetical protein
MYFKDTGYEDVEWIQPGQKPMMGSREQSN